MMPRDAALSGEERLIDWLRERTGSTLIGDDAAFLPRGDAWAVSVDSQIEGTHFPPARDPWRVGRRLVAVAASDLAAVGADPGFAFLTLAAPKTYDHRRLLTGVVAACDELGLELAGGDLAASDRVATTLTVLGTKPPARRWLRRDGASAGEAIWVGGPLGLAAAGLALIDRGILDADGGVVAAVPPPLRSIVAEASSRQLEPRPQLELGRWLGSTERGAALDLSDGLARDLHRLCRASGVGAELDADALPIDSGLPALAGFLDRSFDDWVLSGGEDYVLLFTLPPSIEPPAGLGARRIGQTTEGEAVVLRRSGEVEDLPSRGYDHLDG